MKKQKYTDFEKCSANALENNIGNFYDPELWEEIKTIHGGISKENIWILQKDYLKALGQKGSRWYGVFETKWDYTDNFKNSHLYGGVFK